MAQRLFLNYFNGCFAKINAIVEIILCTFDCLAIKFPRGHFFWFMTLSFFLTSEVISQIQAPLFFTNTVITFRGVP